MMDYAIVRTGGHQIMVAKGDVVNVERMAGEPGDKITLDEVIMVKSGDNSTLGSPLVDGAKVSATIERQGRGRKIVIRKFKRRKGYLRTNGHRQYYTRLRIDEISA